MCCYGHRDHAWVVVEGLGYFFRERCSVCRKSQKPCFTVADELVCPFDVGAYDGQAGGEGFHYRIWHSFPEGGEDQQVMLFQQGRNFRMGQRGGNADFSVEPEFGYLFSECGILFRRDSGADALQVESNSFFRDYAEGVEEEGQSLLAGSSSQVKEPPDPVGRGGTLFKYFFEARIKAVGDYCKLRGWEPMGCRVFSDTLGIAEEEFCPAACEAFKREVPRPLLFRDPD